jgi:hypothetical protein
MHVQTSSAYGFPMPQRGKEIVKMQEFGMVY